MYSQHTELLKSKVGLVEVVIALDGDEGDVWPKSARGGDSCFVRLHNAYQDYGTQRRAL